MFAKSVNKWLMYDKLKLWIDRADIEGAFSFIPDYLTKATELTDRQTGETKVFGCLEGLKVSVFCSGVSVIGSLSKYYYPNNIYPLDRHTTKEALTKLSDALHADVSKANVTGLEFGTVLLLSHSVPEYLQRLGEMPYPLHRYHFEPTTLYYRTNNKQQPVTYAFYDKIAEAKQDGLKIPVGFEGQNLLKYEIRLNRRLPRQLNVPEVKASTLYNKAFYKMLMRRWQDDYFSIKKQKQIKTDVMDKIQTVTDAYNVFVARLMAASNKDAVAGYIEELKENKVFKNRSDYNRLKNKIQEVASKAGLMVSDELIKELDDAIKNTGAYI